MFNVSNFVVVVVSELARGGNLRVLEEFFAHKRKKGNEWKSLLIFMDGSRAEGKL